MSLKLSDCNLALRRRLEAALAGQPQDIVAKPKLHTDAVVSLPDAKRIRQTSKPLLNKLEEGWMQYLANTLPPGTVVRAQALKLKLANGAFYKPDLSAWVGGKLMAWECKGPKRNKGAQSGILAVKVAAAQWPEIAFMLVTKDGGRWHTQPVLP